MESLPIEMMWKIAEYLSAQDLSACCSVSQGWRDIFSHDAVWKPHCDPSLEEYLRTTPCTVEPGFVSPEGEDSTLSPVGHWRLAFMRENHLWNNWQQGRYTSGQMKISHDSKYGFLGNDNVLIINDDGSIDILNLFTMEKKKSQLKCLQNTYYVSINSKFGILIRSSAVQVVFLDEETSDLVIRLSLFFDELEKLMDGSLDLIYSRQSYNFEEHVIWYKTGLFAVVGTVFVGSLRKEPDLHIWDLETGNKLKTENCLFLGNYAIRNIIQSRSSEFIVLVLMPPHEYDSAYKAVYIVYDLKNLSFLPFRSPPQKCNIYKSCALYKHYIALTDLKHISVYNCFSTDLIYTCRIVYWSIGIIDNFFVFNNEEGWIAAFNPINRKCLNIYNGEFYKDINQKFLQLLKNPIFSVVWFEVEYIEVWLIQRSSTFRELVVKDNCHPRFSEVNLFSHSFSRLLKSDRKEIVYVDCFW